MNDPDMPPQRGQGHVPDIHFVNRHSSGGYVVEARNEIGDARLSAAANPDESYPLSRFRFKADVLQDLAAGIVTKRNVFELDPPLDNSDIDGVKFFTDR